jgi:S1-C subfamily serine protease
VSTIPVDVVEQAVLDQYNVVTTDGAFVSEVSPGSGAAVAGLRSGDVIVAMDGKDIVTNTDVGDVVAAHQGGDTIEITLEREGAERTVSVTLGTRGG